MSLPRPCPSSPAPPPRSPLSQVRGGSIFDDPTSSNGADPATHRDKRNRKIALSLALGVLCLLVWHYGKGTGTPVSGSWAIRA